MWTGQYKLASRIIPCITRHSFEQRNDFPAHIFGSHIEPQASIRFVLGKFNKAFNGQVNALARLIPVAIEDNEGIFWYS